MSKKIFYTYNDMQGDLLEIIRSLNEENWVPNGILAIGRGGYIPGVYLSQWLELPLYTYHYSLRDLTRRDTFYTELVNVCAEQTILVIDDICDSGLTFEAIQNALNKIKCNAKFACLIDNIGNTVFEPDFWGREIDKEENPSWIVFPWEDWWKSINNIK